MQPHSEQYVCATMTYREDLRWRAFDTHGVITTDDAASLGVPAVELRKLARRGALEHRLITADVAVALRIELAEPAALAEQAGQSDDTPPRSDLRGPTGDAQHRCARP